MAFRRILAGSVLVAATLATTLAGSAVPSAGAATPEVYLVHPGHMVWIHAKGNGHGHGMSQWGAYGAASAGLTYDKIVGFYYPSTTLSTLPLSFIRVRLSGHGTTTTVAATPTLTVSSVGGALPTTGVAKYRLVTGPYTGLLLQKLGTAPGSAWTNVQVGLPNGSSFQNANLSPMRLYADDGSSNDYWGTLTAWRTAPTGYAGGVYTVNRLLLDRYTAGVTPRESPAGWPAAAVQAQAVAARTYGRYNVEHPLAATYDICDTTQCQVYGGISAHDAAGNVLYTDDPAAIAGNSNQVLVYAGHTIFSQFSASNGGWTVDGGQPYLVAKPDPYDNAVTDRSWFEYGSSAWPYQIAAYFGLKTVTKIDILARDGHGMWGGRITSARIEGTNAANQPASVNATGWDLQDVFGVGSTWLTIVSS